MAILFATGFETQTQFDALTGGNSPGWDTTHSNGSGTTTFDTTTFKNGAASIRFNSGAGNGTKVNIFPLLYFGTTGTYYCRYWFRVDGLPTSTSWISTHVNNSFKIALTSTGKLRFINGGTSQVGSDSSVTISTNTWYLLDLRYVLNSTPQVTTLDLKINGIQDTLLTGQTLTGTNSHYTQIGWGNTAPGANKSIYFDDFIFANTQPTSTKVLFLKPISDNQRGSWTAGAGGTTNLYDAVDNIPIAGVANGSMTNTTQIISTDTSGDNATDEYRVNLTTYTNAGVGADDRVDAILPFLATAENATSGTKTGSYAIRSNPDQGGMFTFTFGADSSTTMTTIGANSGWAADDVWTQNPATQNPSITKGNSPVFYLRRTDAVAGTVSVASIGAYIAVTEFISSSDTRDTRISGVLGSSTTRDARLTGLDTSSNTISSLISGDPNLTFEGSTYGWTAVGSTLSRDTGEYYTGSASLKVLVDGVDPGMEGTRMDTNVQRIDIINGSPTLVRIKSRYKAPSDLPLRIDVTEYTEADSINWVTSFNLTATTSWELFDEEITTKSGSDYIELSYWWGV